MKLVQYLSVLVLALLIGAAAYLLPPALKMCIRDSTYGILEQDSHFTLSFFGDGYREALNLCGSKSGRELDKLQAAGLDALELEDGGMGIAQARLILSCRKLYADNLKPEGFLMPYLIAKNYPHQDFHRMYIGEITNCYIAR